MTTVKQNPELLPHLFRQEYSRMTAVLCRHFGLKHIEIAEDIAGETFLKASEFWPIHGIPDHPIAWLYKVAKNKTGDYFKRLSVFEQKIRNAVQCEEIQSEQSFEFNTQIIQESQLAMIFAVCNPANSKESQIALALQILCGFSVEEIADAFLTKPETIKKRLHRARTNLRDDHFSLLALDEKEIKARLDTVLKTLYLLFNEGYFSKSKHSFIREDLCSEALRLALLLSEHPLTNTPSTNALMALMCFQSSRLQARSDEKGNAILFEAQDRSLWDEPLIEKGNFYLLQAFNQKKVSKYHLEASIAYWHTTAENRQKWQHILELYNQLILLEYSSVTALNRAFAFSKVYGAQQGIIETEKLNLNENSHYHALLGCLYSEEFPEKAIRHYEKAIQLTKSTVEKQTLHREIERLRKNKTDEV